MVICVILTIQKQAGRRVYFRIFMSPSSLFFLLLKVHGTSLFLLVTREATESLPRKLAFLRAN